APTAPPGSTGRWGPRTRARCGSPGPISIQRQRPTRLQRRSVSWRRRQSDHAEKRRAVR
ncbi:hypothetical protein HHFLNI_HHFLNI_16060, partial [Dysosmobacter welbionis]